MFSSSAAALISQYYGKMTALAEIFYHCFFPEALIFSQKYVNIAFIAENLHR